MSSCGFLFFTASFSTVFAHFLALFLYTILTHLPQIHTYTALCLLTLLTITFTHTPLSVVGASWCHSNSTFNTHGYYFCTYSLMTELNVISYSQRHIHRMLDTHAFAHDIAQNRVKTNRQSHCTSKQHWLHTWVMRGIKDIGQITVHIRRHTTKWVCTLYVCHAWQHLHTQWSLTQMPLEMVKMLHIHTYIHTCKHRYGHPWGTYCAIGVSGLPQTERLSAWGNNFSLL